jgi:hypothetical protein
MRTESKNSNRIQISKWIRVRPLEVSDFKFVRRLAAQQPNFTIPPPYVLWLLKQTNVRSCLVAEHVKLGCVAYLLSILVSTPRGKVLNIWQLAASKRGREAGAIELLLLGLRAFGRRARVRKVFFTADPESAQFRAVRRHAYALGLVVRSQGVLPASVSRNEHQFMMTISN